MEKCGAPTQKKTPCSWPANQCPVKAHARWRSGNGDRESAARHAAEPEPAVTIPAAVEERDLREVGWWLFRAVVEGSVEREKAGPLISLLRVLQAVGPGSVTAEEALARAELLGQLMHGLPPRDEAQWQLARDLFDDEAMETVNRIAGLADADGSNDG